MLCKCAAAHVAARSSRTEPIQVAIKAIAGEAQVATSRGGLSPSNEHAKRTPESERAHNRTPFSAWHLAAGRCAACLPRRQLLNIESILSQAALEHRSVRACRDGDGDI